MGYVFFKLVLKLVLNCFEIGFELVIITKGFIMIEWLKRAEMGKRV